MKKAAVAVLAALSFPCGAGELDGIEPSTQFYVRIPIGPAASRADLMPSFGLAIKGQPGATTFTLDSRLVARTMRMYEAGAIGGFEVAKILIVGGAATGAAVAISRRTKTESNQQQQQDQQREEQQKQQQQQQQTTSQNCPKNPPTC